MPREGFYRSQVPKESVFSVEIATMLVPRGLFQAGLTCIFPSSFMIETKNSDIGDGFV